MSEARKKWIVYVLTPLVSEAWAVRTITKIPELVVVVLNGQAGSPAREMSRIISIGNRARKIHENTENATAVSYWQIKLDAWIRAAADHRRNPHLV
ncbi:bfa0c3a2-64e9-44b3-bac4-19062dc57425 [Thermothielavioides terrestris]|uniref:Bfa0c3a2-64e9-44b3-bac4-19062dc57425 n=1 Tax=Thermothielavioides terrestris TaxID=2587410 RepID=A0A446BDA2_9PEZI|nr:bfa0c3a2-64e9-44b3-bac4-19062dc57425 [Thermothielavioides terrestris]